MKPATRITVLHISILIMTILFISQTITGLGFVFNIVSSTSGEIHKFGGLFFAALVIMHVILNWNWITANYFKHKAKSVTK